ncbi:MAG: tyrosinase family protein [Pseudomonadota bacterium]|nr:tyrosinase family protein [Pseudomonadota bacterium]
MKKVKYPPKHKDGGHQPPEYQRDPYTPDIRYYVGEQYYGAYATSNPPEYVPHSLEHSCFRPAPEYDVPPRRCEDAYEGCDPQLRVRINQAMMTQDQRDRFLNAYQQLIDSNFLGPLVSIHSNATHQMHGNPRFLPWHRVYLLRLEEMLQSIDPTITIPYWRSSEDQSFPGWLSGFLPAVNGHTVTRNPGAPPILPDVTAVNNVINNNNTFASFAPALEGIHNTGHVWVGGSMSTIANAPADPVFWMHHAEIDRIWNEWQGLNPGENPNLMGAAAVMDPWSETETDTRSITQMGYTYA